MTNNSIIEAIVLQSKHTGYIPNLQYVGFPKNFDSNKYCNDILNAKNKEELLKILNDTIDFADANGLTPDKALYAIYFRAFIGKTLSRFGVDIDKWACDKLNSMLNGIDNNSPSKQEIIEQPVKQEEEKKPNKPALVEPPKKEAPEQQPIKPQPQNEQPKVAHDLRQQPQGFNIGNFMPPSQANRPQLSRIEQKYEHLKKHIKFIPNTRDVGEDWIDFMNSFVHSDFLREKLIELGSQCNPNHPMLFEVKLEGDMSENGTYDIAFRVNCKNKKQFIIVKLSTKPVQIAGTNGFYYPADAVLMGI